MNCTLKLPVQDRSEYIPSTASGTNKIISAFNKFSQLYSSPSVTNSTNAENATDGVRL